MRRGSANTEFATTSVASSRPLRSSRSGRLVVSAASAATFALISPSGATASWTSRPPTTR